ncbi:MAG: DUF192 domain-containing protein [Acidimicrobiia bacterium]|nr:DUF192 domain-containing protein [Acidimicrobiia bacterium]
MAWLLREGEVLAALEIADSRKARRRGLVGRDGIDGALLLPSARMGVHSFGMRFVLDVAFCDRDMVVRRVVCLRPLRLTGPSLRAPAVLEAEGGAFDRWQLRVGDRLELKE